MQSTTSGSSSWPTATTQSRGEIGQALLDAVIESGTEFAVTDPH